MLSSSPLSFALLLLALPLTLLAAPANPPSPAQYAITQASVVRRKDVIPRNSEPNKPLGITKTLSFTVNGMQPGNIDILCTGTAFVPERATEKT
ncbi:MAG: hypothetical protein Q9184_008137, partial [Pyrenodesmia sp. 2 TL-2023]